MPLLTPDVEDSKEGQIHHDRFQCQEFIRPFLDSLKKEPRTLTRISSLGTLTPDKQFQVTVFAPERVIGSGTRRHEYWDGFDVGSFENSVVFFDPDNGFETKAQRGKKWIRHDELKDVLARLPETSVVVVYQHKPHRTWDALFADLKKSVDYAHSAVAVSWSSRYSEGRRNNYCSGT